MRTDSVIFSFIATSSFFVGNLQSHTVGMRSRRGSVARAQLKPRHALSNRLFQYSAGFGLGEETLCIFVDQEPLSNQLSRRIPDRLDVPPVISVPFLE